MKNSGLLLLTALLFILTHTFCGSQKVKSDQNIQQPNMQTNNNPENPSAWKKIDSLENQGLPKSALAEVEKLYAEVKAEEDNAQIIKCLIYRAKYQSQLEEDGLVNAIYRLQQEMDQANNPSKAILQSMLAEMYSRYLSNNYWQLQNRTTTPDFKPEDIRTWTIQHFVDEASMLYMASVEDQTLSEFPIENFDDILRPGRNNKGIRPSIFDFLSHRAIDFFMNERNYLTEPAYKFYLDQSAAFASIENFTAFRFESPDSTSAKLKSLRLFQDLLKVHLKNGNTQSLLSADLKRLRFVASNSVHPDKSTLHLEALERLAKRFAGQSSAAEIAYEIASWYFQQGQAYTPGPDEKGRYDWKKAYDLCSAAIEKYPDTYGAKQCRKLQETIKYKNLSFQMEAVNIPDEPMLSLLKYRNINKVWLKVIPVTYEQKNEVRRTRYDDFDNYFSKLDAVKEWKVDLPDQRDYREHSVELKVEDLPIGLYAVLVADNSKFSGKNNALAFSFIHVSNLSYWSRNRDEQIDFVMTNRKSGHPETDVKVEFLEQQYNSKSRQYDYNKIGEAKSDADGFVELAGRNGKQVKLKVSKGNDVLFLDDGYYSYRSGQRQKHQVTHYFLDRAIYRPGQQIHFKVLAIEKDEEQMPRILANQDIQITLMDVNRQQVKTLQLKTNEYGTASGSFEAPLGGLAGQMSLRSSIGRSEQYFRVEEYKRPKFQVIFDPVKESYKLEDMVTIKGHAKAFAGNNVDGASVKYRVVREVRYPWIPWWYWRGGYQGGASMEITNGETTTDENGKFSIEFQALADRDASPENKPQFIYQVYADVTDISGETRSGTGSVSVGYIALLADVIVPPQANRNQLEKITIKTTNLNGQFEAATGQLKIELLQTPSQTFRKRLWEQPDVFQMSEAAFRKDFPYDAWKEENEVFNWPVSRTVFDTKFDTKVNPEIAISTADWPIGKYAISLKTKDKYGQEVEKKQYLTLYDLDVSSVPSNEIQFNIQEKKEFKPNEIATFYAGSAEKDLQILYEVGENSQITQRQWLDIEGLKKLDFRILEQHRGNTHYSFSFVRNNRPYFHNQTLNVPWSNKKLNIEYATFRDKLYPGQEEEWQIKISGEETDRVAAEMVATLYDASLDDFTVHNWNLSLFPYSSGLGALTARNFRVETASLMALEWNKNRSYPSRHFRQLNWFNFNFYHLGGVILRGSRSRQADYYVDGVRVESEAAPAPEMMEEVQVSGLGISADEVGNLKEKDVNAVAADTAGLFVEEKDEEATDKTGIPSETDDIQVRTNLKETVFFMPDLRTDAEGNVIIKFKMNEALTRWKFLGMAHTPDLKVGLTQNTLVTQKDLMVVPNAPRFFRENDEIIFTAKVSNLTENALEGEATLQLFDAVTLQPVDQLLGNQAAVVPFKTEGGQSAPLAWKLKIPVGKVNGITHRVIAKAGKFSDGEESSLPVLTNRMMVTESLPLAVRGGQKKDFVFKSLKASGESNTLQHHKLTLEFTSNPAWYAIQALPYLMEYPHECTEQIFNRYYANSLASGVANSHPKIKAVFEKWKNTDAMLSNLSKNQELKSALLEETPWVLQAQSEEQQKKNIGVLFDLVRMSREQEQTLKKMVERQLSNGGFSWFPGGRDNWYMTQYIVEGMGHLNKLGANEWPRDEKMGTMEKAAVRYIDDRIVEHYDKLVERIKRYGGSLDDDHLDQMAVHYLYARSFYLGIPMNKKTIKVRDYYLGQGEQYWNNKTIYMEGMIAMALHRYERPAKVRSIINSLAERALQHDELGMYWKYDRGFYWYELPIETHALMIELFDEVANDPQKVDDLKVWLLKNKQTKHWKTTKGTAAAIYALLLRGDNWLLEDQDIKIMMGGKELNQAHLEKEAGTGYFKTSWKEEELSADLGDITVENPNKVVAWGGVYWQYFEQLDKIKTFEETPLQLKKQLFREEPSPTGPVMKLISEDNPLRPGDKIKVRIELRVDRGMEYVHMKDMRASGFEPINVLSKYKWQGGLGYYESTIDVATHFFFSYLPPGTHVFEYPLRVNHKGDFSNGITSIQCMYAPEFSSHSEGIRVTVE